MIKSKIIWRPIDGYGYSYIINNFGTIRSLHKKNAGKKILQRIDRAYYYTVRLSTGGKTSTKYVHRLLAETFIPNPLGKQFVNHVNGDQLDNRLFNLEWVSHSENIQHAYNSGMLDRNKGINHGMAKQFKLPGTNHKLFNIKETAEILGFNYHTFRNLLRKHGATHFNIIPKN